LFRNPALIRYLGVATALLVMVVFLGGSKLPIQLYFIGILIGGFSSMVSWRAPIAIVIWGSTFLVGALFDERVRPVIAEYFKHLGI
jgi:hypothetical protein